jgi:hypothetical protein
MTVLVSRVTLSASWYKTPGVVFSLEFSVSWCLRGKTGENKSKDEQAIGGTPNMM